jgi:hypothetical protein
MHKSLSYEENSNYGAVLDPWLTEDRANRRWIETLTWSVGMVGGLIALVAIPPLRVWRSRLAGWFGLRDRQAIEQSFSAWCCKIRGRNRDEVVEILGKPHATSAGPDRSESGGNSLRGHTWYYRYESSEMTAVALQFCEGRVVRIEFIATVGS